MAFPTKSMRKHVDADNKLTRKNRQLVSADFPSTLHEQSVKCPYAWSKSFTSQHAL
jgi:hypothetical protein